jgi:hypothetical protein
MVRFNWEKLSIEDLKEDMVLAALLNGINAKGPLMAELAWRSTTTFHQFMSKAKEFMNQEETINVLLKSKWKGESSGNKGVFGDLGNDVVFLCPKISIIKIITRNKTNPCRIRLY